MRGSGAAADPLGPRPVGPEADSPAVSREMARPQREAAAKPGRRFRSFPGKDHFGIAGPVPENALRRSRPQQPPHLGGECSGAVTE